MKYKVEVTRESWDTATFEVEARSIGEAEQKALALAANHEYGSGNARYNIEYVTKEGE